MSTSILILGSTGFVGVPLTQRILAEFSTSVEITALVRSPSKASDALQDSRITFVEGDISTPEGLELATSLSSKADLVIDNVSSTSAPPTEAAIAGLTKRYKETGKRSKLIHVSGTANFITPAPEGKPVNRRTWNDANEDDIAGITPAAANGAADYAVLKAGQEGHIDTYIVSPSGLYGGSGKRLGVFQEIYFNNVAHLRYAPYNGPGESIFGLIHLDDVVDIIFRVFKKALSEEKATGSVYSRYYIASVHTYSWKEIAEIVAPVFHKKGLVDSPEPKSSDLSVVGGLQGFLSLDMSLIASNAKSLGWSPKGPKFEDEVPRLVEEFTPQPPKGW